jgi:hypothetical protein
MVAELSALLDDQSMGSSCPTWHGYVPGSMTTGLPAFDGRGRLAVPVSGDRVGVTGVRRRELTGRV